MTVSNDWYSALVRIAVLVEGRPENDIENRSVIVFQANFADDWQPALDRARELGRSQETQFRNSDDELVRWVFVGVETLDRLESKITDGREVYSEFVDAPGLSDAIDESGFNPDELSWGHSGV